MTDHDPGGLINMLRLRIATALAPETHRVVPLLPTAKMCRAASKAMSPKERPTPEWMSNSEKHAVRYVAMVKAHDG